MFDRNFERFSTTLMHSYNKLLTQQGLHTKTKWFLRGLLTFSRIRICCNNYFVLLIVAAGLSTATTVLADGTSDKMLVETALTCCGMPCDMCILLDVGIMMYVCWFCKYRPSKMFKCILIKWPIFYKQKYAISTTCTLGRHYTLWLFNRASSGWCM